MSQNDLQGQQRVELREALCLALQKGQHRAGKRVTQSVERSGHARALARFIEDRADATRRECTAIIGEKQRRLGIIVITRPVQRDCAFLAHVRASSIDQRERRIDMARLRALGGLEPNRNHWLIVAPQRVRSRKLYELKARDLHASRAGHQCPFHD